MLELVLDCPHCRAKKTGFTFGGVHAETRRTPQGADIFNSLFVCRHCQEGVVVVLMRPSEVTNSLEHCKGDPRNDGFIVTKVHPMALEFQPPEHTPAGIAQDYLEAWDSLRRGNFTSAGMMFRKVLQRTTLELTPDKSGFRNKRLLERINLLAEGHLITEAMRDWAHFIRLEGNQAAHDEDEQFTSPRAKQLKEFTELLLLYAFTLPKRVEDARAEAEAGQEADSA